MMQSIKEELTQSAIARSIAVIFIPDEEAFQLGQTLALKYTNSASVWQIWEGLPKNTFISFQKDDAWKLIKNFILDDSVILLFNEIGERTEVMSGVRINNGYDLEGILEESFGFDFYITNDALSYFLCFDDHGILYAAGEAKQWLENKLKSF